VSCVSCAGSTLRGHSVGHTTSFPQPLLARTVVPLLPKRSLNVFPSSAVYSSTRVVGAAVEALHWHRLDGGTRLLWFWFAPPQEPGATACCMRCEKVDWATTHETSGVLELHGRV
jgi:hypothetical protein